MDTNDGGPAFPAEAIWRDGNDLWPAAQGMSLRDWFAGQAKPLPDDIMNGGDDLLVSLVGRQRPTGREPLQFLHWFAEAEAAWKYMQADAMLAARAAK